MNNTMKNLKDEIEGKQNYKRGEPFNYEVVGILLALLNTYSLEDEQSEGAGKLSLSEAIEALTSLIEQENEQFLIRFKDYVFEQPMNVKLWHEYIEQYLAERKA